MQLEKPQKEKTATLTVHHIQLDDFGDEVGGGLGGVWGLGFGKGLGIRVSGFGFRV